MQRENMWEFVYNKYHNCERDQAQQHELRTIFLLNNIITSQFAEALHKVLTKYEHKRNSMRLVGIPNSGKTLLANCICAPFITCYMNNHGSENEFFMSNMLNKSIILCEELYITIATAEDFKSVLGGQPIDVAKKFNEKQMLNRTPVIITSNYHKFGRGHLSSMDENALKLRCFNFMFNATISPSVTITPEQFYCFIIDTLYNFNINKDFVF